MAIADAAVFPIAAHAESVSPHEVTLVRPLSTATLLSMRLIGLLAINPTIAMGLINISLMSLGLN